MKKNTFLLAILMGIIIADSHAQNTWTQKTDFGGSARRFAVGFSIGDKGYIGTGIDNIIGDNKDFWEYDPATDVWTQKADFGGGLRDRAVGFSIGSKGYIGTGETLVHDHDLWEYDPLTNVWTQKADFAGGTRDWAVGFGIGDKGYLGTGEPIGGSPFKKDF